MNYTLTTTIGIDHVIQSVQTDIYEWLTAVWDYELDGYGRIYKNLKDGKYIPEYFIGDNEYKEVYFNDKVKGSFMFIVDEKNPTEDEMVYINDVKVVFMLNLGEIFPTETNRADSMAHRDAVQALRRFAFMKYSITGVETGVENVFRGFDTSKIDVIDIHPNHCFSVNLKLSYYLTDKCE